MPINWKQYYCGVSDMEEKTFDTSFKIGIIKDLHMNNFISERQRDKALELLQNAEDEKTQSTLKKGARRNAESHCVLPGFHG